MKVKKDERKRHEMDRSIESECLPAKKGEEMAMLV